MRRFFALSLATLVVLAFLFATIAGCAPLPRNIPLGKEAAPPIGAVDYCKRNPQDELCHE